MKSEFPSAVPEVPVSDIKEALTYYKSSLGFTIDWGGEDSGIAGISQGHCRMFLTDRPFRAQHGNAAPVVVWFNVNSKAEVDALFEVWRDGGATIASPPESKPWKLHEFTATDIDSNLLRVFYDFSRDA
jgi:uncharacterized glyoxalase superfamily protein PhnB